MRGWSYDKQQGAKRSNRIDKHLSIWTRGEPMSEKPTQGNPVQVEARAKRESRAAMKSRKPTMRAAEQGLGAAKG